MSKRTHIRLTVGAQRFNHRIAGLAFRDGHVLVHRAVHEPFWTFPGGTAEIGETSEETLKREMMEELGLNVTVSRLLWTVENFFHCEQRDWHELGFYYLMEIPPEFPFRPHEIVHRVEDGDNHLEFKWVAATRTALTALDIPPYFIAQEIENLPAAPRRLVWRDGNLDD
ncbi:MULTISPECIES: NUDIX hydrolase [Rhizobium]|uniref:NUDIX hydrolase n=1 Tax=Rhizobium TaxID=379 RepID=UPI0007EB3C16|nr:MULTISPECIES: NUDIX hydrolase [Rhizobium]ANK93080.1 NUDIX hydrolase domain-containing protein [Rhizobium sp. N6212]ANK99126.1 NUDIX hydrolase domain-containing protein [Rhizobium sp. N621]ANL05257.1 NUDIX hydrolase domain-containing protein [Rhizobium esperanzae]ANL11311.1 NUDIX hydrolase domain-containing protein [Rhizobium sp. N1341]ANL23383.1 NUDIX hydrolase domain-containing protein [Rhizobium sp. N113]